MVRGPRELNGVGIIAEPAVIFRFGDDTENQAELKFGTYNTEKTLTQSTGLTLSIKPKKPSARVG